MVAEIISGNYYQRIGAVHDCAFTMYFNYDRGYIIVGPTHRKLNDHLYYIDGDQDGADW